MMNKQAIFSKTLLITFYSVYAKVNIEKKVENCFPSCFLKLVNSDKHCVQNKIMFYLPNKFGYRLNEILFSLVSFSGFFKILSRFCFQCIYVVLKSNVQSDSFDSKEYDSDMKLSNSTLSSLYIIHMTGAPEPVTQSST